LNSSSNILFNFDHPFMIFLDFRHEKLVPHISLNQVFCCTFFPLLCNKIS
jgi:hypothetical protein